MDIQTQRSIIQDSLTLFMVTQLRVTDNIDVMRLYGLAGEIERNPDITLEELKRTSGFLSTIHDVFIPDEFILEQVFKHPVLEGIRDETI